MKGVRSVSQFFCSVDIGFSITICTLADVTPPEAATSRSYSPSEYELEKPNLSEYFLEQIGDWQGFLGE